MNLEISDCLQGVGLLKNLFERKEPLMMERGNDAMFRR